MSYSIAFAIGFFMLGISLLPAAFLIYAAIAISRKLGQTATRLLVIGAVLLAIASINSAFNYFGAILFEPQVLARILVVTSFVFESLQLVALVLIGIGLILLSKSMPESDAAEHTA